MASEAELKYETKRKLDLHHKFRRNRHRIGWLLSVGLTLSFLGVIRPEHTYVRCDDVSISFKQQSDSISIVVLLVVSLVVPFLIMFLFEWSNNRDRKVISPLKTALTKSYDYFASLFVGNLFSFFIVEMLKTAVSEPRPHFLDTCGANFTQEMCRQPWIHVTVDNCTNPYNIDPNRLMDSMKSFPSGHASIGIFSALFITMYIQNRVKVKWSTLLTPWLHMVCWVWALLCCASRVWDNRHHWWDVVAGAIIGLVAAYVTVKYFCNYFKDSSRLPSTPTLSAVSLDPELTKLEPESDTRN